MPDFSIFALGESQIEISNGKVLDGVSQGTGEHLQDETITLLAPAWEEIFISDNDPDFQDTDGNQRLDGAQTFDGAPYDDNIRVEAEYGLVLTDGTNTWTVVGFNLNTSSPAFGTVEGLAFIGGVGGFPPIGVELTVDSYFEGPRFAATEYATPVCYAEGSLVATVEGLRPIETLQPGDQVMTRDNGVQPIVWRAEQSFPGRGRFAPIEIPAGVLGAERTLRVSGPHRLLIQSARAHLLFGHSEVFASATKLVGRWGIRRLTCDVVRYHHILLARHDILLVNGVWAESLFPGGEESEALFGPTVRAMPALLARPDLRQHEVDMLFGVSDLSRTA